MLTGKVGLRDPNDVTADSLVLYSFLRNHPMPKDLRYYFQEDLFSKVIGPENPIGMHGKAIQFGPFNGTPIPSWIQSLSKEEKNLLESEYMTTAKQRIAEIMNVAQSRVIFRANKTTMWPP